MAKMINLGREYDCGPCSPCCAPKDEKKLHYPSLYISDIPGLDLSTGEITFTAVGRVVSVTDRDGKYSCEIEIHSISNPKGDGASGGLREALDDISSRKSRDDY